MTAAPEPRIIAGVDLRRAEAAVRDLLLALGEDPDRDGLRGTPARVARAYMEMLGGLHSDPASVLDTTFGEDHDEIVLVKDIPVYSLCEQHLLPWRGNVAIGYIPGRNGRICRLVEAGSPRRLVRQAPAGAGALHVADR